MNHGRYLISIACRKNDLNIQQNSDMMFAIHSVLLIITNCPVDAASIK